MNETPKRYFKVTAKCGHVGRSHYVPISFPVAASCGKEAAAIARWYPRVKHHHSDAIINCEEIDREQYYILLKTITLDPYLQCKCKRDQRKTLVSGRACGSRNACGSPIMPASGSALPSGKRPKSGSSRPRKPWSISARLNEERIGC